MTSYDYTGRLRKSGDGVELFIRDRLGCVIWLVGARDGAEYVLRSTEVTFPDWLRLEGLDGDNPVDCGDN